MNDGVLSTLDYTNLDTYMDCIKGRQTNKSKKNANKSSILFQVLESQSQFSFSSSSVPIPKPLKNNIIRAY